MSLTSLLDQSRPIFIDGGLSTQLERMGHDVNDSLWTARVLLTDPTAIEGAHRAFVDAGAHVVITASYQVSRAGFVEVGLTEADADRALAESVRTARRAVGETDTLVAASVGPYGAITHDGGEYRGNYGLTRRQLNDFHAERLAVLLDAEPDLLAIETIPDVDEVIAITDVLDEQCPAWLTVTARDGETLPTGQPVVDAVGIAAEHPAIQAVGVNCTDPTYLIELMSRISDVTDLPIVVYPNAGGTWDPTTGRWTGSDQSIEAVLGSQRLSGVAGIGGCCGVDAAMLSRIVEAVTEANQ